MAKRSEQATLEVVGKADFSKIEQEFAKLDAKLNQVSKAQKGLGSETSKSEKSLLQFAKGAQLAIAGLATSQVVKFTAEMVQLDAAIDATTNRLDFMTDGKADLYVRRLAEESGYLIDEQSALQVSLKLVGLQLVDNEEQAAQLATKIAVLGQAFKGVDAGQAADEFALMMANMSIPRLDSFGLSASKVKARIDELMASTAGMTKEAAFQQAVMEELDNAYNRVGGQISGTANDTAVLKAAFADLKVELAGLVSEGLEPSISMAAKLVRGFRDMKAAQKDFAAATAVSASSFEEWVQLQAQAKPFNAELKNTAYAMEKGGPVTEYYAKQIAKLREEYEDYQQAAAKAAGADVDDKLFRIAEAARTAAEATAENTGEVISQEQAVREAEQAYQKYIQGLRDAHQEHKAIAGITADLVGQFDTLGKTFYSITPVNNDAAAAAERYAENLENLRATAGELTYDIQFMGDGEGALQEKLNETNAVIAQQEAALNNAAAAAGNLQNVYTITQLTQEQMQLLGNSWIDVLETTGNELALTGAAYDNYRVQMGLATEEQIRMEAATRQIVDAMEQGTISATQAGDAYAAVMTGQANAEEFIAQQEAANQQLLELGYTAESLGLADVYEGAQEPAANFAEQLGASADAAQAMEEHIPAAFEALTEVAPAAAVALNPVALALQNSEAYIKGMIASAPEWAAALNEAGGALAMEGSGVSLAASVLAGMQQDWRYLQNNPRLELEALVTITTIGGVGAAGGANFITKHPMLLPVGEIGPERVTVEPLYNSSGIPKFNPSKGIGMAAGGSMTYTGNGGGGGTTVNIGNITLPGVKDVEGFMRELERRWGYQGKYIPEKRMKAASL